MDVEGNTVADAEVMVGKTMVYTGANGHYRETPWDAALTSGSNGSPIEGRETCRTQRFGLKTRHSMLGSKSDREGPGPRPSTTSGRRRFSIRTPERPLVAPVGIYCARRALRG
jgi:hypothetical protein